MFKNGKSNNRSRKKAPRPKQSRLTVMLKTAMVLLVVILLLFVAAETFGDLTVSNISRNVSGYFDSLKKGDGYPLSMNSSTIKNADTISSDLFLLTETNTISLDSSAKTIDSEQHTYTTPIMEVNGDRAIIYDLNGTKFKVQTATKVLHDDMETEKKILTAAVGKSGNIAVATYSDSGKSMVTVYDKKLKKIFIWNCSAEYIVDISLSDNGKRMAVIAIGSAKAEIYSKLYVLDFDYTSELASFEYPGTSLFDVQFNGLSTIIATGDNLRSIVTKKNERGEDILFGSATVSSYAVSQNGTTSIVLSESGSVNSSTLYVYNKKNQLLFETKLSEGVKHMDCNDNYVTLLFDSKLVTYNFKGKEIGSVETSSDTQKVFLYGKKSYIIASNEIRQVNVLS